MALKFRRGSNASRQTITPAEGELLYVTDHVSTSVSPLWVGDGSTAGGKAVQSVVSVNSQTGNIVLTTDNVTEGTTNKYYLAERARDDVAAALVSGSHTGIAFTYGSTQDNADRIDAAVTLSLNNLSNVLITGTPSNDSILKYNTFTNKWINADGATTKLTPISQVGETSYHYIPFVANVASEGVIKADGALKWQPSTETLSATNIIAGNITAGTVIFTSAETGILSTALSPLFLYSTYTDIPSLAKLVQVGNNSYDGRLGVTNNTYSGSQSIVSISQFHTTADATNFSFFRGRGTSTTPTAISNGDDVIDIAFSGHDGTSFLTRASISATVDGAVSTGVVPLKLTFNTAAAGSGNPVNVLTIDSSQKSTFTGNVEVNGTLSTTKQPATFWNYDSSGSTLTLTVGQVVTFANFSGSVLVNCYNSGCVTQYLCGGGTTPVSIGNSKGTDTGSMQAISGGYTFTASEAGVHSFYVIRTRTGA